MKRDWTDPRYKCEGEGCCRVCRRHDPEAAHIIPRSQVSPPHGEHPDNIVPLCHGCHRDYDTGAFDLLPYLTRKEQAKAVELHGLIGALRRITNDRQTSERKPTWQCEFCGKFYSERTAKDHAYCVQEDDRRNAEGFWP